MIESFLKMAVLLVFYSLLDRRQVFHPQPRQIHFFVTLLHLTFFLMNIAAALVEWRKCDSIECGRLEVSAEMK